ncbi:WhiB family transcriptional regulator [Mycetocola manganoxydans]|uniref:WhiB family transcriptional regulator n=1 Tax=Mycetocola manganoxydans TaxID=699879 RepID=UPI001601CF76
MAGTRAGAAANDLVTALLDGEPSCRGDDRFTADSLANEDAVSCRKICKACPVFEVCRAYAAATRPAAGMWAGRRYGGRQKEGEAMPRKNKCRWRAEPQHNQAARLEQELHREWQPVARRMEMQRDEDLVQTWGALFRSPFESARGLRRG